MIAAITVNLTILHWHHLACFEDCHAQLHWFRLQDDCSLAVSQGSLLFQFICDFHKTIVLRHSCLEAKSPCLPNRRGKLWWRIHIACHHPHLGSGPPQRRNTQGCYLVVSHKWHISVLPWPKHLLLSKPHLFLLYKMRGGTDDHLGLASSMVLRVQVCQLSAAIS